MILSIALSNISNNQPVIKEYFSILFSIVNYRTWVTFAISAFVTFLVYEYSLDFNVDLTLLSIAIIFPLVFTIRGSFRRREKALEHLSRFRANLKTVQYFLMSDQGLNETDKKESSDILNEISLSVLKHLGEKEYSLNALDEVTNKVYVFVLDKNASMTKSVREKVFRFMRDVHRSIEDLHAIHSHRTPISLKAYCKIFIYIFPFLYAPTIINNIGGQTEPWVAYAIVMMTEFILISLYNIQDQLEYPFDDIGVDDVKLGNFKIYR